MAYHISTRCQHLEGQNKEEHYGAISYPIYPSSAFIHQEVGGKNPYDYSRLQNPTRAQLEKVVASLEHGTDCIALSSGIAALACIMELFRPGDHIIIDRDLYGGSIRYFREVNEKNGLQFSRVSLHEEGWEKEVKENTKAIFLESPTNPCMNVNDIEALGKFCKAHNLLLIVDNTFLSPYFQNPLELGADIVLHSGTKFLSGHHDAIAGFIVVKDEALQERLRFLFKTTGAGLDAFDSWLILRGIKTLAIRMEKAQENSLKIAEFLEKHPKVKRVLYPGLPNHPGHELMKKQARGFGAMISFDVESGEEAKEILKRIQLIYFAESLGGTESLLTYPLTQTHADVPKEILAENGIYETTLRLSVGIEDAEDLISDLKQALE